MSHESFLYVPLTLHVGADSKRLYAPLLSAVPNEDLEVMALAQSTNFMHQGLYVLKERLWQFILPQIMVSEVFTQGFAADIYLSLIGPLVVDPACIVYKNGVLFESQILEGDHLFCVLTPAAIDTTAAEFIFLKATRNLSGHRVVKAVDGGVDYASIVWPEDAQTVIGLTSGATLATQFAKIQISGELMEPSWNWQLGPVFNGVDGLLTQTNPSSGYSLVVGIAIEPTKILISLKQPIVLT